MRLEFFMPMVPPTTTFQAKQLAIVKGKPRLFDSAELKAVKAKLRDHVGPHAPDAPLSGAVRLMTKWCWPVGETHGNGEYKATKPDTDNLVKALKDAMAKTGFFTDDAQVASEITEKFWADVPGIYVMVEEV